MAASAQARAAPWVLTSGRAEDTWGPAGAFQNHSPSLHVVAWPAASASAARIASAVHAEIHLL